MKKLLISIIFSSLIVLTQVSQAHAAVTSKTGGTNFAVYDLKNYTYPTTISNIEKILFIIPHYQGIPYLSAVNNLNELIIN